ncbi:MAG: hypothetical protein CMM01_16010 [Rhodopirellula sp.]|nr:hypothetical protein [Rhodopirellula sp.]
MRDSIKPAAQATVMDMALMLTANDDSSAYPSTRTTLASRTKHRCCIRENWAKLCPHDLPDWPHQTSPKHL